MTPVPYAHPSGDALLSLLGGLALPLAGLVRSYPGASSNPASTDWIDSWFREECSRSEAARPQAAGDSQALSGELERQLLSLGPQVSSPLKLCSVRPQHFRGFRKLAQAIELTGDLVVLEGRNSSGKTSLVEAIEWLFTGQLQRRLDREQGNPRELVDCVQSQLRPEGETTFVEAVFIGDDTRTITVRRTLVADYTDTSTSRCVSTLMIDGISRTEEEAHSFFQAHFAGVPPLLMQHTLREFVHSSPTARRVYFERLLTLNELTALIEKAVVGDSRLKGFPSATGSRQLARWTAAIARSRSPHARRKLQAINGQSQSTALRDALLVYAKDTFSLAVPGGATFQDIHALIMGEQRRAREAELPLLKAITPHRSLDEVAKESLKGTSLTETFDTLKDRLSDHHHAMEAAASLSEVEQRLAPALTALVSAGLISVTAVAQDCPLCEASNTLREPRLSHILDVGPLVHAAAQSAQRLTAARDAFRREVAALKQIIAALVPVQPSPHIWDDALEAASEVIRGPATDARTILATLFETLAPTRGALADLSEWLDLDPADPRSSLDAPSRAVAQLLAGRALVADTCQKYAAQVDALVATVSTSASDEAEYALRESWLELAGGLDELRSDLAWEDAKHSAQARLSAMRNTLMIFRHQVLETRRTGFSTEMSSIWDTLRSDTFSRFKDLYVPPPAGKGYPVAVHVRATLDDGVRSCDVDALRVFSESQVHVLGIAAFLTRSKLIGHTVVVLDDPVQSMDEEHFKTFAADLTTSLLESGLQVIILTHNDQFARDLSWAHSGREGYVSLELVHSRRKGCLVNEGSRRVQERLRGAERKAEDGDLGSAWRLIRLSLERLYILVKLRDEPTFDANTWRNATAEHMWAEGVGDAIESAVPGSGKQLKRLLDESAAGAHDKSPKGLTDVLNACKYVRGLLASLRVGG